MKIGAIVQARTSSTRLPKKILLTLPISSKVTVLQHVIRRLQDCKQLNEIIIATSTEKEDKIIIEIAEQEGVKGFQGDLHDLLSRYYFAAKKYQLDVIVRITSDCPCIDPQIIDQIIEKHLQKEVNYSATSSGKHRSFPHGIDIEVFNFTTLETVFNEATSPREREHVVGPYIQNDTPDKFSTYIFHAPKEYFAPDIRITLDTEEDYIILCAVYDFLYKEDEIFSTNAIIQLFQGHPWLKMINKRILQKKIINSFQEERDEAIRLLDLQGLHQIKQFLESNTEKEKIK